MFCIESFFNNGESIYYIDVPAKYEGAPLLVLLHGFPDNAFGWEEIIEEFKGEFHIIAPFMHGTLNDTEVSNNRISTVQVYDDLLNLIINNFGDKKVFFIGHDLGCFLSVRLSKTHLKDQVEGLININGMGLNQYSSRKFHISQMLKSYYIFLAQFPITRLAVQKFFPNFFLKFIYKTSKVQSGNSLYQNDARVFRSIFIYSALFKRFLYEFFTKHPKVNVPTIFLWGNDDSFLNVPSMDETEKFYTQFEIRVLRGGHWIHKSNSKDSIRLIRKFFNQHKPSPTFEKKILPKVCHE